MFLAEQRIPTHTGALSRMLVCMRTSMNLPDGLLQHAKAVAAEESITVTELVIQGLRLRIESGDRATKRVVFPTRSLGRASIDISDNRSVRDLLDSDGDGVLRDSR